MIFKDYGFFQYYKDPNEPNLVPFKNENGQDWYELRDILVEEWGSMKLYAVRSAHDRWMLVDADSEITNVETDITKLMPGSRRVVGVDGPGRLEVGMIFDGSEVQPPKKSKIVPFDISRRQFFQHLAKQNHISKTEALSAVKTGELPESLRNLLSEISDEDVAFDVEMALSGSATFERDNPATEMLGELYGWTSDDLDNVWIEASKIA